jgi:hypothetical protein
MGVVMRFQIASDLHLEHFGRFPRYRVIEPAPDADALILAGDIHSHANAIKTFSNWPVPVLYVHGTHEAFRAPYWEMIREIARTASGSWVRYLERDVQNFDGIRVLGCCLWTDYALDGNPRACMNLVRRCMPEFRMIQTGFGDLLQPEEVRFEFIKSRQWLTEQLQQPFEGKTVVVTHHAPHRNSIPSKYAGDELNGAYASDLSDLMPHVDLWVHGAFHHPSDYYVGNCHVVSNPRGLAFNTRHATRPDELVWENTTFKTSVVVEV